MVSYLAKTDIRKLINEVVETWRPMIESKGVKLTCFIADDISEDYMVDRKIFHNCLNTLISNAAHYTDNGRVHIHTTAQFFDPDKPTKFTIIVADTGQGISHEQQLELIKGNSRLSEMIKMVKTFNGKISFKSSLARGSEFILSYPCHIADKAVPSASTPSESVDELVHDDDKLIDIDIEYEDIPILAPQKTDTPEVKAPKHNTFNPDDIRGLRVLIVDDVSSNQDVVKLFLNPEGCECYCTAGGEEAIEFLKTQAVDVILMDIRMPGMNGIETIRTIRNSDLAVKNIPIIALTADGSAQTNAACMAAGTDLFLTKPVLCRDLIESIRFVRRYQDLDNTSQSNVA